MACQTRIARAHGLFGGASLIFRTRWGIFRTGWARTPETSRSSNNCNEWREAHVAVTKELGWGVLADGPSHEIVMGAVTQPWKANVVFRSLPPDEFAAFSEPGYVRIAWTLRADAISDTPSVARTETRVVATDAEARRKFRWYWARFSPGIVLIRAISLRLVKKDAERRALV
jgi:hypothetical protein